jgi:hypothetical protein
MRDLTAAGKALDKHLLGRLVCYCDPCKRPFESDADYLNHVAREVDEAFDRARRAAVPDDPRVEMLAEHEYRHHIPPETGDWPPKGEGSADYFRDKARTILIRLDEMATDEASA